MTCQFMIYYLKPSSGSPPLFKGGEMSYSEWIANDAHANVKMDLTTMQLSNEDTLNQCSASTLDRYLESHQHLNLIRYDGVYPSYHHPQTASGFHKTKHTPLVHPGTPRIRPLNLPAACTMLAISF